MTAVTGQNPVPEGTPFNRAEIDAALEKQGTEIRRGDVVLFHTGWQSLVGQDNQKFISAEPGLGKEGAEYLASLEVMAVGADTWGLEAVPFEEGVGVFEIHQILLAKNGIYILENMNTAELVSDQAWEFMFVEGHGRITGGVQAIINPVAIR
jgi:kynurenine formamidase